jgi:beta-glucosidase
MRNSRKYLWAAVAACAALLSGTAVAQDNSTPAYKNPKLSAEQRAQDLVSRMTLEEKASQMINTARAIPRLGIPQYNWWSEALHGVIDSGVTEFPEPIGLGATFDAPLVHAMAVDIGTEGRIKHEQDEKAGHVGIGGGLDFWAPNLNLFRDPRWGRGQETYGEDPYLIGRMGVAFVTGMQGDDPNYYRVIATPKHFVVHSGPEPTRHFADVDVSRHDEVDTYEPGFRAAVVEGHAGSVMCAYNAINGQPACANQYTLQHLLRGAWGFQGYVVSDCDAVHDIFTGHRYRPTQAQATAISVERGMDNECFGGGPFPTNDTNYKPYIEAVQQGYLSQHTLDTALVRLFTARFKLGMFDPPGTDPYSNVDESQLDSPAHRALARKLADEAMVLLKNDGTLPLKPGIKNIAVVGPLADQTQVLLGNYAGRPTHIVSLLDGLKAAFPDAHITFVPGTQFLRNDGQPVPDSLLTTSDGKPGLEAVYKERTGTGFRPNLAGGTPLTTRVEPNVHLSKDNLPAEAAGKNAIVQWSGFLTPPDTGDYLIGIRALGFGEVTVGGDQAALVFGRGQTDTRMGTVHLVKGQKAPLSVMYSTGEGGAAEAQLLWEKVNNAPSPEAIAAAKKADVVIAAVGITSRLEGEEMRVNIPGFLGGDRTSIDLPQPEEDLVEAMAGTGKPVVVVLMNGSALAVNWIGQHANSVVEAWYSGEEGGNGIADVLSGKYDPAGRLPVTFYKSTDQLPHFEDYSMKNRTYRYFTGKPLYPFGYGLSYTTFSYSNLTVPQGPVAADAPVDASATVTNTGKVAGDEVVQLYLKFPAVEGAPRLALRGFQRIHLNPGESQQVRFELKNRDLGMVTENGQPIIAKGQYTLNIGGGQPDTGAPDVTGHFQIDDQIALPE